MGLSKNGGLFIPTEIPAISMDEIKNIFKPEFLNRIDEIIMFDSLSKKDILGILNLQLDELSRKMAENDIHLTYTQSFVDYLSDKGFDPAYGARPIKRAIQRYLLNDLSKQLLAGAIDKSKPIKVDAQEGALIFSNR